MGFLDGKTAIITGAGRPRGIGRSCALRLAHDGADVVISDICRKYEGDLAFYNLGDWEQLQNVVGEVEALGRRALAFRVDVTKKDEIQGMIDGTLKEFGRIDILVNNAGSGVGVGPFLTISEEAWDKTFEVNAKGTYLCCQAVLPTMLERKSGKIVNIASTAGLRGNASYGAYGASKFAVVGMTQIVAAEFAQFGINVNCVCPAMVETDLGFEEYEFLSFVRGGTVEEVRQAVIDSIPLGRAATGDDIADVVAFLVSEQASYMIGQAIAVTGGMEFGR
ncbi:MAG: SDR family oxidoreductase [Candidatus Hydrogenedentota bacterium]|nr:MAG: SDR family oxidoreductase [Candidatus Hydrogenedentota bacterium]